MGPIHRSRITPSHACLMLAPLVLILAGFTAVTVQATAQYLFLDANGDGQHTDADIMPTSGSVIADLWIRTDQNRNGTPAVCVTGDRSLTINSYEVILRATNGVVTYSDFVNHMTDFTVSFEEQSSGSDYHNGYGGEVILPPGSYRLASITITALRLAPSIQIVAESPLRGTYTTSFGANCSGYDFDNTLKLGSEWFDTDGLPSSGATPSAPVLASVQDMTVVEGTVANQALSATDVDGEPLTFSKVWGPDWMTVTTANPGTGIATGTLRVAPYLRSVDDRGVVRVSDGFFHVDDSLLIHVTSLTVPELHPIPPISVMAGQVGEQVITASDPDLDPLRFFLRIPDPTSLVSVSTLDPGAGVARGLIRVTPPISTPVVGVNGSIGVTDGQNVAYQPFTITIGHPPPALAVPEVTLEQHTESVITLKNVGGYAPIVTYSKLSGPDYATVERIDSQTGRLRLAPTLRTHVGTADVVIGLSSIFGTNSQRVVVHVSPNPLPPVVQIGSVDAVMIHTLSRLDISSYDPDGDAITSLSFDGTGLPSGELASFEYADPRLPRHGYLSWTPSTLGTFPIRFTAVDEYGSSTTFERQVTVHSRWPVMTSASIVRALPLEPISHHVTVEDPDGDPITAFDTDVPSSISDDGGVFHEDPQNLGGTLAWTPSSHDGNVAGPVFHRLVHRASDGDLTSTSSTVVAIHYTHLSQLDVNALDMLISNAGQTAYDVPFDRTGFVYPKGSGKSILNALGTWVAGCVGDELRLSRAMHDTEFFPGTLAEGPIPEPYSPRFRNFRIERGNTSSDDYRNWPVQDGAPVDAAGRPRIDGDQMIWSVAHDMEPGRRPPPCTLYRCEFPTNTPPVGIELRQTTFAFADSREAGAGEDAVGPLASMAFLRFELTNRSGAAYDSAYVALWAEPMFGDPGEGRVGSDPERSMVYAFDTRVTRSPALGLVLLESPMADLGMEAASGATAYGEEDYLQAPNVLNLMQGKHWWGDPMRLNDDPGQPISKFCFTGDPVAGTGWLDLHPGDGMLVLSAGPFPLAAGETAEYVAAVVVGQGSERLASVSALRDLAGVARYVAASDYTLLPYVRVPAEVEITEGSPLSVPIEALDLDGDALTSLAPDLRELPKGHNAVFTPAGSGTTWPGSLGGTLTWTPTFADAGTHIVRFTASNDRSATFEMIVHVMNVNRAPTASAGGPYVGAAGVALEMSAKGSSDPDGDVLAYAWDFGDGSTGTGITVEHAYGTGRSFPVTLSVNDGALSTTTTTTAEIVSDLPARAFAPSGKNRIKLASSRPTYCFQLEPVGGSFEVPEIDPATIRLISEGTGSVNEISGSIDRTSALVDRDHNGASELTVCFETHDFRRLFDQLHPGEQSVEAAIEGGTASGARFRAPIALSVHSSEALASHASPNPLTGDGTLAFRVTKSGWVRVTLLDVSGRVVDTMNESVLGPGYHDVPIRARGRDGRKLASGVYFYSIEAAEGTVKGRIIVLK